MYLADIVQLLQFLFVLFVAFFFVYSIFCSFKFTVIFIGQIKEKNCSCPFYLYMRSLCSVDYTCFHKYQIWRFYRFS